MRKRQVWVEPLFAEAKEWHGLRRFRLRGLPKVNIEGLLIAAGQNLKRLLRRGAGAAARGRRARQRAGPPTARPTCPPHGGTGDEEGIDFNLRNEPERITGSVRAA